MVAYKKCTLQFWITLAKFIFLLLDSTWGKFLDQQWTSRISRWSRNLSAGRLRWSFSFFYVSSNEDQSLAPISVPVIQTLPMATPPAHQSSSRSTRRVLPTVHVFRADIPLDTGKSLVISIATTWRFTLTSTRGRCHYPFDLGGVHAMNGRRKFFSGRTKCTGPLWSRENNRLVFIGHLG